MKLMGKYDRYWELLACTTAKASKHQFDNGSGWFANIAYHPNASANEKSQRSKVYWDHGGGIKYWYHQYGKKQFKVTKIKESHIEEGHCTRIRNKKYLPLSPNNERRDLSKDLNHNYSLKDECVRLGLKDIYDSIADKIQP
jgi:hypothetical protein